MLAKYLQNTQRETNYTKWREKNSEVHVEIVTTRLPFESELYMASGQGNLCYIKNPSNIIMYIPSL